MKTVLVLASTFPRWKNDTTPSFVYELSNRLANKNETYCCLGEVMSLAASNWSSEYSAGNITSEIIYEIADIANEIGFKIAPYQAFGKIVSELQTEKIKQIIHNNNHS